MRSRAAVASGAMFIVLAFVLASTAHALINVDNTIHTGVFSISSGQTVRVHAQHVAGRGAKCETEVRFFRAGQSVLVGSTLLTPTGGGTESAQYTEPAGPGHRLRAVVELTPTPGAANGNCIVSAEVVDGSGQTQFVIGDAVEFQIVGP